MKKLLFLVIIAMVFNGCKSSSTTTPTKTTLAYLTNGSSKKWKVTNAVAVQGSLSVNLLSAFLACSTDNVLILKSDLTYQLTEGATKCQTTDPDIINSDSWSLTESPKTITIQNFTFLNKTLAEKNAVFNITAIDDNSFSGTLNTTYQNMPTTVTAVFSVVN